METLLARIAHIRTWTYVSHRDGWLADPALWQQRTRAVEDRLSDTLHERLTEQFVERGAAVVSRALPGGRGGGGGGGRRGARAGARGGPPRSGCASTPIRALTEARGLRAIANRALRAHMGERVRALAEEPDAMFTLGAEGQLLWRGAPIGRLLAGDGPLTPRVEPLPSDLLDPALRERVRRRLAAWVDGELRARLPPLAPDEHAVSPPLRGLLFAWRAGLGTVARRDVSSQLAALTPADRQALSRRGISLGRLAIFAPALLRPEAVRLRALLWSVHRAAGSVPLLAGAPSVRSDPRVPPAFYRRLRVRTGGAARGASGSRREVRGGGAPRKPGRTRGGIGAVGRDGGLRAGGSGTDTGRSGFRSRPRRRLPGARSPRHGPEEQMIVRSWQTDLAPTSIR